MLIYQTYTLASSADCTQDHTSHYHNIKLLITVRGSARVDKYNAAKNTARLKNRSMQK